MGLEPTASRGATGNGSCGCVICLECRAALALQTGHPDRLALASFDGDLQRVIGAWDRLPNAIQKAVLALVGSQDWRLTTA